MPDHLRDAAREIAVEVVRIRRTLTGEDAPPAQPSTQRPEAAHPDPGKGDSAETLSGGQP